MEQNTNANTNWRELFSLYRDLVEPFKEFEKQAYNKRTIERGASDARGTIDYGYIGIIREAFLHTLKYAIPFLIAFYVITNVARVNGEKLFYYYGMLVSELGYAIEDLLFENGNVIFEIVATFILLVPFTCLIIFFPLMIVGNVISRTHSISQAKKTLKVCEEVLPQAESATQEAWKRIAPYVKKIPPNYQNSSALAFFSNSFFNSKVKNLQEAVNLYDQYLHQQRMEQSQREIAEAQRESMDAIDALSRQMDYLQDQIDSLEIVNNYYY